jgi:protein O-GlcNAc transferase
MKKIILLSLLLNLSIVSISNAAPTKPNTTKATTEKAQEDKSDKTSLVSKESFDLNERGVAQIKSRDFITAEETFRKALAIDPTNITAAFNYASTLLINKKEETALKLLKEYTVKAPDDAGLKARLGDAYFGTKDVKSALKNYEETYKLDPEFPEILTKLATTYLLQNRPQDAEKFYSMAAEKNPRDVKSLSNLSSLYLSNGKPDKAIAAAKKALQLQPTKEIYITLATAYEIQKDYKNSLIAFQRAADLGDNRPEVQKKIEGLKEATS